MKYNPCRLLARLRIGGRMSEKGADRAGTIIAVSVLMGVILFGVAAILTPVAWMYS